MHRLYMTLIGLLLIVLSPGCSTMKPDIYTGRPQQLPLTNQSDASGLLECLGLVLEATSGPRLDIIVGTLDDGTLPATNPYGGFLSHGGQMMSRTSLAILGSRIGVLGETYDPSHQHTVVLRGKFTELDRVTPSQGWAGSYRVGGVEFEFNKDHSYDFLALDLELANVEIRQIPGMAVSLLVIVDTITRDAAVLLENSNAKLAASNAFKFKAVGRRHGAQRLLIETGIFLLLARHLALDVTPCINAPQTDMASIRKLVHAYRDMNPKERIKSIQRLLNVKHYKLLVDGVLGPRTRRAVKKWQLKKGQVPTGELSTQLYVMLKNEMTPMSIAKLIKD